MKSILLAAVSYSYSTEVVKYIPIFANLLYIGEHILTNLCCSEVLVSILKRRKNTYI